MKLETFEWRCSVCTNRPSIPDMSEPVISPVVEMSDTRNEVLPGWTCVDMDISDAEASTSIVSDCNRSVSPHNPETVQDESILHSTFEITQTSFEVPVPVVERSIEDPEPEIMDNDDEGSDEATVYTVIEKGTTRGKPKLCSSDGFSYTISKQTLCAVHWVCHVRGKKGCCPARIVQKGDIFVSGAKLHTHPCDPGALARVKTTATVKQKASENVFRPAGRIVEEVMLHEMSDVAHGLPDPLLLSRIANRHRQASRPDEPTTLDFQISTEYLPEAFLQADIRVDSERHLLFATTKQLELLGQSRRWYLDGTFRIVKHPFVQLFSIHAFIRKEGDMKQVPLAFCLMSRRRKKDYKKVFKALKKLFQHPPVVEEMVTDFEKGKYYHAVYGIWVAAKNVFSGVPVKGCVFHWTQAVWRKAQEIGLRAAYMEKEGIHRFIRKLLSLPFLPHEHILPAFECLQRKANDSRLRDLTTYVNNTWMNSSVWSIKSWSIFGQSIRTNNDVEGWHRRLNSRAGRSNLQFYLLVKLMYEESSLVLSLRLVSERKLKQFQRRKYRDLQCRIFLLWEQHECGEKSASQLLSGCSRLYAPVDC